MQLAPNLDKITVKIFVYEPHINRKNACSTTDGLEQNTTLNPGINKTNNQPKLSKVD